MLLVFFVILCLPHFSSAAIKPIVIFSLGGGYSLLAEGGIRSNHYIFETLIDFKEEFKLKNLWSFNLQAYFLKDFGIQVEFTNQKADYFSDLKWYGWWYRNEDATLVYVPINHFENPRWSQASLKSFNIGFVIGGDSPLFGGLFPYATAGIGFLKLQGDRSGFLNRSRLGSLNHGMTVRISGGVRHRIMPFLGINLRISGETIWDKHRRTVFENNSRGPDQLSVERYYQTGEIFRAEQALVKALTYFSFEISMEIILRMPGRTN